MKLLLCNNCGHMFNLSMITKACSCGRVKGRYTDNLNAIFTGKSAVPFCIGNGSFETALSQQRYKDKTDPEAFHGARFESWICPANSDTFLRKDDKELWK